MALNFPGPDMIEILYSVAPSGGLNILHRQNLNCNLSADYEPGTSIGSMTVLQRSGSPTALSSAITAWATLMRPIYSTADATIIGANVWRYTPGTFERTFLTSTSIALSGSSGTGTNLAWQNTLTFKTQEGGEMRLVFLETVSGLRGVDNFPYVDASFDNIADFVLGTTNWIMARDTSYPIAAFNHLGGENERIFRKRFRV